MEPTATERLAALLGGVDLPQALVDLAGLIPGAAAYATDARRDLVWWSPGAEALLGFTADEVRGRHCLTGVRCAPCLAGCGVAQHGRVAGVRLELHRKDGAVVAVRKWAVALRDRAGDLAGTLEVLVPEEGAPAAALGGAPAQETVAFHGLRSADPAMIRALATVQNVAETDATVLVRGESGTGKELVARALHAESLRRAGPFVAVNCAAFTPSLLESELFGHVRGAFTGATHDRPGIFVQADGGTLFLDEVGELPLELQAKLLRVLQERVVVPVGGSRPVSVDVRVVAATHRALREEVRAGRFREDLMYRLRVVPVFLPPLRERPADVPLLLRAFLDEANARGPRRVTSIDPAATRALLAWPWPGNVRELQNVVTYAFAVGRAPVMGLDDLPPELRDPPEEAGALVTAPPAAAPPVRRRRGPDPAAVEAALRATGGDLREAAARLGVSRTTLWRWRTTPPPGDPR